MTLHLVTNSVAASQVRETEDTYVIEDVPFVRPMELAGGYVPESSIKKTIEQWDGVPATLRHPRNAQGQPIAANRKPETHLGIVEDPYYDGDVARATVVVRKDRLDTVDGADAVREKLEGEQRIDVSSQYASASLPPGEYDGAMRENVERIARPDSLAILPHQQGKCSIKDGCGIDPQLVANAAVQVPMTPNAQHGEDMDAAAVAYEVTTISPDDVDEWTDQEWDGDAAIAAMPNPSEDDDAAGILDQTHAAVPTDDETRDSKAAWKLPFREGQDAAVNTRALVAIGQALSGARGGVEGLDDVTTEAIAEWTGAMLQAAPDELFGSRAKGQSANVLERIGRQVTAALGLSAPLETNSSETTPAESGVDRSPTDGDPPSDPASTPGDTMKRDTLIDEITSNSKIDRESLEGMGDQCLQATHEHVVSNDDDGTDSTSDGDSSTTGDGGSNTTGSDGTGDEYVTESQLDAKLDTLAEDISERVTANRDAEKKSELAEEIVANSNDYDDPEAVQEDFPTVAALQTKRDAVTDGTTMPGAGGLAANADLGGDGTDFDVSAGVLTDE